MKHHLLNNFKVKILSNIKDTRTLYQQQLDYKQQCDKVSKLKAKQSFIRNKKET